MNKKGFSVIEVVLVLALLAIVLTFTVLYSQTAQVRADVNSQAELIVNELRLLRSNAESGNTKGHTAIKLKESSYTSFFSPNYDPEDPTNQERELSPVIKINNKNLNDTADTIIFERPHGRTENYGSFDLRSDQIDRTITIKINEIGAIDY